MRRSLVVLTVSLFGILLPAGRCQSLQEMEDSWRSGQYSAVLPSLTRYWEGPNGRTWQVEYMIGTGECRTPGLEENGRAMLLDALQIRASADVRKAIQAQLNLCRGASSPAAPFLSSPVVALTQLSVGASVSGPTKGGFIIHNSNRKEVPQNVLSKVTTAELGSRRIPDTRPPSIALNQVSKLLQPLHADPVGKASVQQFIVTTDLSDDSLAQSIGECLLPYKSALEKSFQMSLPNDYVFVYAIGDQEQLARFAGRLHGMSIPPGTVAYSVFEDLSIVGMGNYGGCGSLAHELTHIMIRSNFGNAPAWLEEGLASEVAIGEVSGGDFVFDRSWRDDMLRQHWTLRPTVPQLLDSTWDGFQAADESDMERSAAVNAMAACFVRYLAAKHKLAQVYFGMRDNEFSPSLAPQRSSKDILEAAFGQPVTAIDSGFSDWFNGQHDAEPEPPSKMPRKK